MVKVAKSSIAANVARSMSATPYFTRLSALSTNAGAGSSTPITPLAPRALQIGPLPPGYSVSYRDAQGLAGFQPASPNTMLSVGGKYIFQVSYAGKVVVTAAADNWGNKIAEGYSEPGPQSTIDFSASIAKLTVNPDGSLNFIPSTAADAPTLVGRQGGLRFLLTWDSSIATSGLDQAFKTRFISSTKYLASLLGPKITVNITVKGATSGFTSALPAWFGLSFANAQTALNKSYTANRLTPPPQLPTDDPTNGAGLNINNAHAKALGLYPAASSDSDGSITVVPTNSGVGPIWHELTHILGRMSGRTLYDLFKYEEVGKTATTRSSKFRFDVVPAYSQINAYFSTNRGVTKMSPYFQGENSDGDWGGPFDDMAWNKSNFTWIDLNVMLALGIPLTAEARRSLQQRRDYVPIETLAHSVIVRNVAGSVTYDSATLTAMTLNLKSVSSPPPKVYLQYHDESLPSSAWVNLAPGVKLKMDAPISVRLAVIPNGQPPVYFEAKKMEWGKAETYTPITNNLFTDQHPLIQFGYDPTKGMSVSYVPTIQL